MLNSRRHILKALASAIGTVPFVKKLSGTIVVSQPSKLASAAPFGSLQRVGYSTYMLVHVDAPIPAFNFVFWTDREKYRVSDKAINFNNLAGHSTNGMCASRTALDLHYRPGAGPTK